MDLEQLGFPLTEEHLAVHAMARQFAHERLRPGAAERDRTGAYPTELVAELAELGLLAMKTDPDDGGSGLDHIGYALAMQGVAEGCTSVAVILASSNLATSILSAHGTEAQRQRWLGPYASGALGPASFALSEPHCGSDAAALRTTARRQGDTYHLDGSKMWITSGAHAGLHIVFAKTDPDAGPRGISCFVVERGTPGLEIGREEDKMGQRASGTVALHFDDCRIDVENRIGAEGDGYRIALSTLGSGRVGMAGLCLGIAEYALQLGLDYATERIAFGRRVADFQNSRFVLADTRLELDAAWLLTLRGAVLLDRGDRAASASSMAKLAASEALGRTVDRMVQLHGGYGYSREYAIERLYRDARVARVYEGSSEIQRLVIARELVNTR